MKRAFLTIVALIGAISLVGCSTNDSSITNRGDYGNQTDSGNPNTGNNGDSSNTDRGEEEAGNAIVVYFSATGNTESVAQTIAGHIDSAIYKLECVVSYTSADLNYGNQSSRVVEEHNRILAGEDVNIELVNVDFEEFANADYVFIGAPVWWQELSWVIEDFVASNDFSNKTIIPFGTSASSGYTLGNLTPLTEDDENVTWLEPQRFRSNVSSDDVIEWVDSLGFTFK